MFIIYNLHFSCLHISVRSIMQSESCLKKLTNTFIHVALVGSCFDTKGMCSVHYRTCQDSISYVTLLVRIFNYRLRCYTMFFQTLYWMAQFTKFWKKGLILFHPVACGNLLWKTNQTGHNFEVGIFQPTMSSQRFVVGNILTGTLQGFHIVRNI